MRSDFVYTIVVLLLLILLLCIINRRNETGDMMVEGFGTMNRMKDWLNETNLLEHFASNSWTKSDVEKILEEEGLNEKQYSQVSNMIQAVTKSTLQNLVTQQSPLLVGPRGPPGAQGPAGGQLIASGRLINKDGSFDGKENEGFGDPKYVVTRTEGTNQNSSLSFMDDTSRFASFQSWQLNTDNTLTNRYDGSCLTMNSNQNNVYMSDCDPNNGGQKWLWDNSNRIISKTASTDKLLKCIGLSDPQTNILTTNVPGCVGDKCSTSVPRRYLQVQDCQINSINPDQLWDFL